MCIGDLNSLSIGRFDYEEIRGNKYCHLGGLFYHTSSREPSFSSPRRFREEDVDEGCARFPVADSVDKTELRKVELIHRHVGHPKMLEF